MLPYDLAIFHLQKHQIAIPAREVFAAKERFETYGMANEERKGRGKRRVIEEGLTMGLGCTSHGIVGKASVRSSDLLLDLDAM